LSEQHEIESLLTDTDSFAPSKEFAEAAIAKPGIYDRAQEDRLEFWAEKARELHWHKPFTETLDFTNAPFAKWFADGELNVSYNCLDRHVEAGWGKRVALFFEGEPGDTQVYTYLDLLKAVKKAANVLIRMGVEPGDRVAIYMPMIPEAIIAMQAVVRIGAVHSVVFGGFSAESLASRIQDAGAKVVITADGGYRKGKASALKPAVDQALQDGNCPSVEQVLVVKRTGQDIDWDSARDVWWEEQMQSVDNEHVAKGFNAEHPLFILYTSGTTGTPKGILHTTGGYLTQSSFTHKNVFDLHEGQDVYWCTADVGWITGHTYVVYGPLANGATQVIYEGTPDTPDWGRWWDIVQKYHVSIFYTAPTAIRSFMKLGDSVVSHYDLSSIRVLGSVGEPINPAAWLWYRKAIGSDKAPIVDTWWQTETGAIMVSALPGITKTKPGSAQVPLPGIEIAVINEDGKKLGPGHGGYLAITEPWPAMLRGIWGDPERFKETYWSRFPGVYFAGDGAKLDADGDLWLLGRVDDVMNISGHRLSTTEIESALVAHPYVAEAAVVGASDETTGQAIVAFVILMREEIDKLGSEADTSKILRDHVASQIGPIARPRSIFVVSELPKTRSGKIMRRLLRDVAEDRPIGDISTLTDTSVMDIIGQKLDSGAND
jgi:acetyl-CoA synthetase